MTYYIAFSKIVRLLSVSFAGSGQLKIARTKGTVNRIERRRKAFVSCTFQGELGIKSFFH